MKIAMISTHGYFDPIPQLGMTDTGGQVVYVLELSKALAKSEHQVDIFTRWFDKTQKQIDPVPNYPNVRVVRIEAGPSEFIPKEHIYEVLPELSYNMISFIKNNRISYNLYHGHYVDAGVVALEVAKSFNKPAFFTAHSLGAWKREQMGGNAEEMEKKFNFKHRISEEMRIFKTVNAHTVTSEVQREKLIELYQMNAENVETIPPGVDIHRFHLPTENTPQIKTKLPDRYIFCLSRIDTNKGHKELLEAFDLVRKEIDDIFLVIGGGSPNPKQRELGVLDMMKKIIREKQMEDKVKMIGYVADDAMATYYQQSTFFVLPSKFEPFGMTSQEAMACGKTVVASKFGGIRNVINNGKNGILIDPTNTKEFAGEMIKLLKNNALNKKIGLNAYQIIQQEYSWEAIADRFYKFYNNKLFL